MRRLLTPLCLLTLTPEQRAKMSGEGVTKPLQTPFQKQNTQDPFVSNVTTVLFLATVLYMGFQMQSCAAPPTPEQTAQANREQESKVSDYKNKYDAVAQVAKVSVLKVRLVPYKLPTDGSMGQMVLIDWKNTGKVPIRAVHADITPFDAQGRVINPGLRVKDYTIYAVENSAKGIQPGKIYREPNDRGFILIPFWGKAVRATVVITRASSESALW